MSNVSTRPTKDFVAPDPEPSFLRTVLSVMIIILVVSLIYIGAQLAATILVAGAVYARHQDLALDKLLTESVVLQFSYIVLAELFTIGLVWWILRRKKQSFKDIGLIRPKLKNIWQAGLGILAFYLLAFVTNFIILKLFPGIDVDQAQDLGFTTIDGGRDMLLTFICLVILPPLAEEILMRGYMFTRLRAQLKFWPTAIIISLLFGFAHLELGSGNPPVWTAGINTAVLSFVLVYLREKTGSLWPSIFVHGTNNFVAFLIHF